MQEKNTVKASGIRQGETHLRIVVPAECRQHPPLRRRGEWHSDVQEVWIPFNSFLPGVPLEVAQQVELDERTGHTLVWPGGVLPPISVQQAIIMAFQLPWPGGNTRGKDRHQRKQLKVSELNNDGYGAWVRLVFENEAIIGFSIFSVPEVVEGIKKMKGNRPHAYVDKQTGTYLKWQGVPGLKLKITTLVKELLGFPKIGATGGRVGGKSKSERKVMAAQSNGAKGGRPKKPRILESVHGSRTGN